VTIVSQDNAAFERGVQEHLWVVLFASGSSECKLDWRMLSFRKEGKVDNAAAEAI